MSWTWSRVDSHGVPQTQQLRPWSFAFCGICSPLSRDQIKSKELSAKGILRAKLTIQQFHNEGILSRWVRHKGQVYWTFLQPLNTYTSWEKMESYGVYKYLGGVSLVTMMMWWWHECSENPWPSIPVWSPIRVWTYANHYKPDSLKGCLRKHQRSLWWHCFNISITPEPSVCSASATWKVHNSSWPATWSTWLFTMVWNCDHQSMVMHGHALWYHFYRVLLWSQFVDHNHKLRSEAKQQNETRIELKMLKA